MHVPFARVIAVLLAAAVAVAAGCSSGGSGATPPPPAPQQAGPTAKVRFINAATRMGTVTFAVGTTQVSVPARGASAEMTVPVTATVVTVTNGTAIGTQTFNFQESWDFDIIAIESPVGGLGLISIFGKEPNVDPATARLTYFNFGDAVAGQSDAYVLAPGSDITTVAPTFAGGGGTQSFAGGTYVLTITPVASKKVLFQSSPFNLALGRNDVIIGAPATASDLTPKPFLVTWDQDATDLVDSRPTVRMLKRLDGVAIRPMTISIDGNVVAQFANPETATDLSYQLGTGIHHFTDGATTDTTIKVEAGNHYVQRFGHANPALLFFGDGWLQPDVANDYPAPPDKARIRLIIETDACTAGMAHVDGAPIEYAGQTWGNAGITFDHAPGDMKLDMGTPLWSRTVSLKAGHYYAIRVWRFSFIDAPNSGCYGDTFEISGDE